MTDSSPPAKGIEVKKRELAWARWAILLLLAVVLCAAAYGIFGTEAGARLREDPHKLGVDFRAWVAAHRVIAPAVFLVLYIAAALCLLPVWWLQILAGYGFGLYYGIGWSIAGAVVGAASSFIVSRVLIGEWLHEKFEARHAKFRELDERMGHNGLIVVMAARLMHFLPFGISNYIFGLSRINLMEVILGTALGNIPGIALYVAAGAGVHPWRNWRFMVTLTLLNIVLLLPIALRYWKPQWFRRIGVE